MKNKIFLLCLGIFFFSLINVSAFSDITTCSENATTIECSDGTFTGNYLDTTKDIIIQNALLNGTSGGAEAGWIRINTTAGSIIIINSTINGTGKQDYAGNFYMFGNGAYVEDSTFYAEGGYEVPDCSTGQTASAGYISITLANLTMNGTNYFYSNGEDTSYTCTGPDFGYKNGGAGTFIMNVTDKMYSNGNLTINTRGGNGYYYGTNVGRGNGGLAKTYFRGGTFRFNNLTLYSYSGNGGGNPDYAGKNSWIYTSLEQLYILNGDLEVYGQSGTSNSRGCGKWYDEYINYTRIIFDNVNLNLACGIGGTTNIYTEIFLRGSEFVFIDSSLGTNDTDSSNSHLNITNYKGFSHLGEFGTGTLPILNITLIDSSRLYYGSDSGVNTNLILPTYELYTTLEKYRASAILKGPLDNENTIDDPALFNGTGKFLDSYNFLEGFNLVNMTLNLFNSLGSVVFSNTETVTGDYNETNWSYALSTAGVYIWNIESCILGSCYNTPANFTFNYGIANLNQSFEASVYETDSQTYNLTFDAISSPTVYLYLNGVQTSASTSSTGGNGYLSTYTVDVPSSLANQSVQWETSITGLSSINTTSETQNISSINLTLCGSSPQDIPFVNFTFKDESDLSTISANIDLSTWTYYLGTGTVTKTFTFANTTAPNPSYAFCFSPPDRTLTTDLTFKYSNTSYPQRTYKLSSQEYTNSTTNQVLYLLGSSDGIYSTIQTVESQGSPISGVQLVVERQFNGIWTVVEQEVTGTDGGATFWVNPNFDHRITATKSGYSSSQVTITPSQSTYTMTLSSISDNATYVSDLPGVKWAILPSPGSTEAGTYNFNATVTSTQANLENCKFELLNATNTSQILATSTSFTNSSYCQPSFDYTLVANQNVFGRLSIDTTSTDGFVIIDTDWKWISLDLDVKNWRTVTSFFEDLKDLSEFGEGNEAEFSRYVFFFLLSTIFLGVFFYFTGFEINNPGISILLIWFIVFVASVSGFLSFESGSDNVTAKWEQYSFLMMFSLLSIGYLFNKWREESK